MELIVLGTSEFSLSCARAVLDSGQTISAVISLPQHLMPLNPVNMAAFAKTQGIPYYEIDDINSQSTIDLLKKLSPDYILCSWPKLVRREVLEIPRRFCIGDHPTSLPYNRGRHPLHWLIAMGHHETKMSFFKMDEGIDSGPILVQVPFSIETTDKIDTVVDKMNQAAYTGIKKLMEKISHDPLYEGEKQNQDKANYWRKRSVHDLIIDMRMPADLILRTVRSFSPPYPCAKFIFKEHILNIQDANLAKTHLSSEEVKRIEPGKIMSWEGKKVQIKADDAIVELECDVDLPADLRAANYVHPPTKYMAEWPENLLKS